MGITIADKCLLHGIALAALLLAAAGAVANQETRSAIAMLETVTADMRIALADPAARATPAALHGAINRVLTPRVDFGASSRLVLGQHWKSASPEQRRRFIHEFREVLVRFYAGALSDYLNESDVPADFVSFQAEALAQTGNRLVLRSYVWAPSGSAIPVDYRVYLSDDWRVYDISIDGVSLARNYRSLFDATIRSAGIDQLISNLARDNAEFDGP